MDIAAEAENRPVEVRNDLVLGDLGKALGAGWRDFLAAPVYGLFFATFFVLAGWALTHFLFNRGELVWLIPAMAGFPLLGPFAAAGLYEVSRRRAAKEPLSWGPILGAVRSGDGQLPVMGVIAFVVFGFWVILAHTIFGIFLGQPGLGEEPVKVLLSPTGLSMLSVGSAVGGIVALFLFAMTVISLPMLIDREVDFISAIIVSFKLVSRNRFVMMFWAATIALLVFLAMVPAFLGLLVALPVLGHATFHLYRGAVR